MAQEQVFLTLILLPTEVVLGSWDVTAEWGWTLYLQVLAQCRLVTLDRSLLWNACVIKVLAVIRHKMHDRKKCFFFNITTLIHRKIRRICPWIPTMHVFCLIVLYACDCHCFICMWLSSVPHQQIILCWCIRREGVGKCFVTGEKSPCGLNMVKGAWLCFVWVCRFVFDYVPYRAPFISVFSIS